MTLATQFKMSFQLANCNLKGIKNKASGNKNLLRLLLIFDIFSASIPFDVSFAFFFSCEMCTLRMSVLPCVEVMFALGFFFLLLSLYSYNRCTHIRTRTHTSETTQPMLIIRFYSCNLLTCFDFVNGTVGKDFFSFSSLPFLLLMHDQVSPLSIFYSWIFGNIFVEINEYLSKYYFSSKNDTLMVSVYDIYKNLAKCVKLQKRNRLFFNEFY